MLEFDVVALFLGNTRHVHQARAIGTGDVFSAGVGVAFQLVLAHLFAYSSLLDGEHSTEAAALVGAFGFHYLDTLFQFEQIANFVEFLIVLFRWRAESQFPHTMTCAGSLCGGRLRAILSPSQRHGEIR